MSHRPTEDPTALNHVVLLEEVEDHLTKAWAIGELVRSAREHNEPLQLYPMGPEPGPTIDFLTTALWLQAEELERAWQRLHAWEATQATPPARGRQGRNGAPRQAPADPEVTR